MQLVGDAAYVLIPANASVPAVGRQVFTTVHPNQQDMSFLVLEGDFSQVGSLRCPCGRCHPWLLHPLVLEGS